MDDQGGAGTRRDTLHQRVGKPALALVIRSLGRFDRAAHVLVPSWVRPSRISASRISHGGGKLSTRAGRAIIKTRIVVADRSKPGATARHLRYVEREGVAIEGGRGRLYGPDRDEGKARDFEDRVKKDRITLSNPHLRP